MVNRSAINLVTFPTFKKIFKNQNLQKVKKWQLNLLLMSNHK
jgi:hypothetical protein